MFEEGRYPMVADPAYLTYFVRRYAATVGLDELEAAREFIAETERLSSPLHAGGSPPADAEPSNAVRRSSAADANHIHASPVEQQTEAKPKLPSPFVLVSQLMTRRMPRLSRHSWSDPLSSRGGHRSRPRMFKFFVGPLALIAAVVMVGPFSPLHLWTDRTPVGVSKTTSPLPASSAILTVATAEASHEPAPIAASPVVAVASLPPAAEVAPPSVDASVPTAVKVALPDRSAPLELHLHTRGPHRVLPRGQSSTDKASDALRAEQLARMRARAAAE